MTIPVAATEIHEGVRRVFNRVADTPGDTFRFGVGASLAREVGYADSVISGLPSVATESFTGLADLHPYVGLRPGESLLDLGSGAGFDAVLAGRAVSPGGTVTGLDMAEAMVAKARHVAGLAAVGNVTFEQGEAEAMPFAGGTFDAALVNGIFKLCPDKAPVAHELFRVLRAGGRAVVAEITFTDQLARPEIRTVDDWFR